MNPTSRRDGSRPALFREEQRVSMQWPLALLLLCTGVLCAVLVVAISRDPNAKPMQWLGPVAAVVAGDAITAIVFWVMRMVTEVRPDGLHVCLVPVPWRFVPISLEGVEKHRPVTYSALREYGGWGAKRVRKGRAYTIWGSRGVRIDYRDGTHVLIGSDQPEQLDRAITALMDRRR